MNQSDAQLYAAHIAELQQRYDSALEKCRLNAVVVAAGTPALHFEDDQHVPFKASPHLLQWGPLTEHPDAILSYESGQQPQLLIYAPADYWHLCAPVPELIANGPIQVKLVSEGMDLVRHVKAMPARTAFVGEIRQREDSFGLRRVNPKKLIEQLQYQRSYKTAWEVANIEQANRLGARGHAAAENCFRDGGSEYDIQSAFRQACGATDNELPYPAIVATNEHAATLHYQRLDRGSRKNQSLLIDAGANCNAYASDITRCHTSNSEFADLIDAMHVLQQDLCTQVAAGIDFRELHLAAHRHIATLLINSNIVTSSVAETIDTGISRAFFPHGLGHFLGLQVHDVGALLTGSGKESPRPDTDPYLRLTRLLEPGHVITMEPGLYFIENLLAPLRAGPQQHNINWQRVDDLARFGGIRIEDNLHITASGNTNLTREAFAAL